jgi:hypothetical protein
MNGLNHRPDVTVVENQASALSCASDNDIDHGSGQVVGPNHLVRQQHPKRGVDRAHEPVAEIRFLPRLNGIDVRGPEDVNAGKTCREQCIFGLSLVAREGKPTSFGRVCAVPVRNENAASGLLLRKTRANSAV